MSAATVDSLIRASSSSFSSRCTRQAAAVRSAGACRRGTVSALPLDQAEQAVRYCKDHGWSCRMIGEELGVSPAKVRAELRRRGIPAHPHPRAAPGSRASRAEAPLERTRELYVESEWSVEDVSAHLGTGLPQPRGPADRARPRHTDPARRRSIRCPRDGRTSRQPVPRRADQPGTRSPCRPATTRRRRHRRTVPGTGADHCPTARRALPRRRLLHRADRTSHRTISNSGAGHHASRPDPSPSGTPLAGATAPTRRCPARFLGPGRSGVPCLRVHRRSGQHPWMLHQHRAALARPGRSDRTGPWPMDPEG